MAASRSGEYTASSNETPSAEPVTDHQELRSQERILAALEHYERHGAEPEQRVAYHYVTVAVTNPPSYSYELLQDSTLPTLVKEDRGVETYSLPISIAQNFGALPYPWWVGLSPAQMHAGPFANEADVTKATSDLLAIEKRRKKSLKTKNGVLKMQAEYARESLRRQILRLPMEGAISRKEERTAMREHGYEWKMVLRELKESEETAGAEATDSGEGQIVQEGEVVVFDGDGHDEYRGAFREGFKRRILTSEIKSFDLHLTFSFCITSRSEIESSSQVMLGKRSCGCGIVLESSRRWCQDLESRIRIGKSL